MRLNQQLYWSSVVITINHTSVTFLSVKSQYQCMLFSHIFRISHFLVFCLCALVHILTLHVLSFQNPIYCYPYYSFVYNVGFYLTEYKLVFPSPQSPSKLHYTCSYPIVVPLYSLRTIVKVLVLVVLRHSSTSLITTAYLRSVGVDLEGWVTLLSTLIPPFIVLVLIGDSVICVLAGISTWNVGKAQGRSVWNNTRKAETMVH